MKLVDSHCHLYDIKGYSPPPDILPVVVGYSHSSNMKAAKVAKENGYPLVLGIAPQTAIKSELRDFGQWLDFIRESRPNAIGEIGLDYKWARTKEDVERERMVFRRMLDLAREMGLPAVIHSRNNPIDNEVPKDAVAHVMEMAGEVPLLMHLYSGSAEHAREIVARGGYISIPHMRSKERRKVINDTPLDRLMVESDSPYVGRTPDVVREAVAYIAEVKGIAYEEVAAGSAANAARFFGFQL